MKTKKRSRSAGKLRPVVGACATPIADKLREWIANPCHGRIAAGFEFAGLVAAVEKLERANLGPERGRTYSNQQKEQST